MAPKGPPKAADKPRRGSSSFFDRVRLTVHEMTSEEASEAAAGTSAELVAEAQEETREIAVDAEIKEEDAAPAVEVAEGATTGDLGSVGSSGDGDGVEQAAVATERGGSSGEVEVETDEKTDAAAEVEKSEVLVKERSVGDAAEQEELPTDVARDSTVKDASVSERSRSQAEESQHAPVVVAPPPPEPAVKKPAATSPRATALFGRLMSAMRNESAAPDKRTSVADAALVKTIAEAKDDDETTVEARQHSVGEDAAGGSEAEAASPHEAKDEESTAPSSLEIVPVESDDPENKSDGSSPAVDAPATDTIGASANDVVAEAVLHDDERTSHSEFKSDSMGTDSDANNTDSGVVAGDRASTDVRESASSSAPEQEEIATPVVASTPLQQPKPAAPAASPPSSSSGLFGRLISVMRTEQPNPSGPVETSRGSFFATDNHEAGGRSADSRGGSHEQASGSLFDRLISTVRNEVSPSASETPALEPAYVPHAEITVDDDVNEDIGDDVDSNAISALEGSTEHALASREDLDAAAYDPNPQETVAEAAAIEEMVELTLDVGADDQDETPDCEPSVANENETVAENHDSEPSVTNEIDHVEEHYPEELQTAVQRAGAALLAVLPSQEAAGVSVECFDAIERMKSDGEVLTMEFVKELENAGVLVTCANATANENLKASEEDLAELRAAAAACCTGRLAWTAVPELLALWAVAHTSVSEGISDEIGEKANVLEPFDIARAAEQNSTMLVLAGIDYGGDEKAEADNNLFDEHIGQAALTHAMGSLKGSLLVSRQRLAASLQAMREGRAALVGGCLALVNIPPLLRLEIMRDFFQTAGLFLSGMFKPTLDYFESQELPEYVLMLIKGLRAAYRIIAIDVSVFIQWVSKLSNAGVFISIGVIMIAHLFFISWLIKIRKFMPRGADNVRHGHEATTWASLATTNKRMAMISSLLITASLTAYLPLTQFCFSVFNINMHKNDDTPTLQGTIPSEFYDKPYWGLIVFEALALLVTFSIPLPFILVSSIRSNRPRGSLENAKVTYDLDGEEVPFDNKVYARLVASDPSQLRCPYRSLYNGFEQSWSTYKVMQLVAKAILAAVVVGSSRNVANGGIIVCCVYFLIVALTSYSRPFIDPVNDLMESSAKFTALVTAVGGTAGAWAQRNDIESNYLQGFFAFVLVVHFVNLWVMLTVMLLGIANTRTLIKNWLGWLSFSDTTRMIDDARAQDIIPSWDINKEAKHRVWQAFWRAVLYDLSHKQEEEDTAEEASENAVKDAPAAARLVSLDQAVISAGIRRVSSHWRGKQQRYTTRLRQVVRTALEGVDVYWNENTGVRDGHLDSKSCFGKMYVVPYPFHCVIVYDNTNDEAIIWDEVDETAPRDSKLHSNLAKLLFLNFSPAIVAKREVRQKIRALADLKTPVRFPFSRVEKALVTDYYEWTPIEGQRPLKIRYKAMVEFTCHYTYGVFKVKTSGDAVVKGGAKRAMADGFIVTMTYKDGRGYAKAPRTGKRVEITGRKAVCDSDHFGLNPDMEENVHLKEIFEQTRPSWELGIKKMRAEHREYRRKLIEVHAEANAILSDDYFYFVYNNQYLSRKDLEQYLTTREVNPLLRQLPQTHKAVLDALYLRQRFIMMSPAHKLWYIFWDDVYARNSDMSRLIPKGEPQPGRACRADFDPNSATSICYSKKSRPNLENWLSERGLLSVTGMFHPGLLQLLYDEMKKLDDGADPKSMMKERPGGRSFKRRSMIASMVWRPAA